MAIQVLSLAFCGLWVYALVYMHRSVAQMPLLRDVEISAGGETEQWPTVSVIVPACNEADDIEAALRSLLRQDYPALEVIAIDDRSTDATGAIIDRIAASDPRVRALHVESLPEGWLGKIHALHCGVEEATGEWYLFTDADVHFDPSVLTRAFVYARRHSLNHLACLPEIVIASSLWLDVAIRSFSLLFAASTRLASVNRPNSSRPVGIGAFNLVEAKSFESTPGFEWLRMEPADDMGLGVMLKNASGRTHLIYGDELLRVEWYSSVGEMVRGLEKNSFGPGANYSYSKQLAIVAVLWLFSLMPVVSVPAGLYGSDPILLAAGGLAIATTLVVALLMPTKSHRETAAWLLLPAGVFLLSAIMLRAAVLCWRNGGIDWRGTHYSIEELRRGQRVRF